MNTKYQFRVSRRIFYADSDVAIRELPFLCRVEDVRHCALMMLMNDVTLKSWRDKALKNLDFLFSEHKKDFHFSSDVFCNRFRDVLNWGLKHLIGCVVTVPVEEHFETHGVKYHSKEIRSRNALELLDYWKENQDAPQEDAKPIEFVSVNERQTENTTTNIMSNKINMFNMIEEILKSGANITISVSPADLKEFAFEVIRQYKQMESEKVKEDVRLSQKEVSEMLGVSLNSLWRWEQKGYLVPAGRVGKKPYYLKSQIDNFGKEE